MFEQPIIIYSEYCAHSVNFLNVLLKHPQLDEQFIKINIDIDPKTRQRPSVFYDLQYKLNYSITEVPTIIVNNGEYILSGEEAFKWLQYTIEKVSKEEDKELCGFNPNEMGSFSDCYSQFGSNNLHDATEQSFKFIHKDDERIQTPQEDGAVTQDDYNKKQRERDMNFSNGGGNGGRGNINVNRKLGNGRIDFTKSNMGFSGNHMDRRQPPQMQMQMSSKEKEIDSKLQELLLQRENITPTRRPGNKKVDFTTGKMY